MAEWKALPEECLISSCENSEIDQRGPVWLRDGSMHKACVEHWEGIFSVLGEQATWEKTDGSGQVMSATGSSATDQPREAFAPNPTGGEQ
jgi:hypothetical protein